MKAVRVVRTRASGAQRHGIGIGIAPRLAPPCPQACRSPVLRVLLALTALLMLAVPCFAAAPLVLTGDAEQKPVAGHMEMLRDVSGSLTFADVSWGPAAAQFKPVAGNFDGGIILSGAYWLRFSVQAGSPEAEGRWWLAVISPLVEYLDVYIPIQKPGGIRYEHQRGGILSPTEPNGTGMAAFIFPMTLQGGDAAPIYIRVAGSRSLNVKPEIWRTQPLFDQITRRAVLLAGISGFMVFGGAAAFVFGLHLRDRSLLLYAAYTAITSTVFLINDGYLHLILPALSADMLHRLTGAAAFGSAAFAAFVVIEVFATRKHFRFLHWLFVATGYAASAAIMLCLLGYYSVLSVALSVPVFILGGLTPVIAWNYMRRGGPAGGMFLFGFSIYSVAVVLSQLHFLGLLPGVPYVDWAYQVAACFTALSIFLGLAIRLRTAERAQAGLQEALLLRARSEGQVLETAVRNRTMELEEEVASRRAAELALETMLREQRHLLAVVSHEFRSPLGIINASTSMLRLYMPGGALREGIELDKIQRAVDRLVSFIEACLADEWLDRAALLVQQRAFDLSNLVTQIAAERAQAKGRRVEVRAGAGVEILGDPTLIGIVVDNLLANALNYSDAATAVHVDLNLEDEGRRISVAVRDHGVGIKASDHGLIFDRYFRGDQTLSQPGIGLGLHMVRRIVTLHGGTVDVVSSVGAGSTFTIRLPAGPVMADPATSEGAAHAAG